MCMTFCVWRLSPFDGTCWLRLSVEFAIQIFFWGCCYSHQLLLPSAVRLEQLMVIHVDDDQSRDENPNLNDADRWSIFCLALLVELFTSLLVVNGMIFGCSSLWVHLNWIRIDAMLLNDPNKMFFLQFVQAFVVGIVPLILSISSFLIYSV